MLHRVSVSVLTLALGLPFTAHSQTAPVHHPPRHDDTWLLPVSELEPDQEIPDSKAVLGYRWGDEISNHHQIERYLHALADAAPDRTRLVRYGESCEGRSLNYLVISSPDNISRLQAIRLGNLTLADPRRCDATEANELIDQLPAIVWFANSVHGNEISPSDAALLTAYHLLSDRRVSTQAMLEKMVVIIDPLQNPDGRDRFVNVFRETRGRFNQSNPYSNEHVERWPGGRTNHYWFDMNRDWFRHSQQETRAKVAAYLHWHPHIYVDAHEMGRNSSYYFPPPADPKNPYLLPSQESWLARLGKHQAGWFDRYGFGYVTREIFDAFYPGYGSEWPSLQGGLGILWEQAGARGLVTRRDDETELTYRDGVRNHYVSGLATLEFAAGNHAELLRGFHDARRAAIQLGKEGNVKDYFITRERPERAARFAAMLLRNGIDVNTLDEDLSIDCVDCSNCDRQLRKIPAGSFHIPVAQPTARLIRALLDQNIEMDEKFLRRQLERNELRLPNEIYDVTAWSMPLAFDVATFSCPESANAKSSPWRPRESGFQTDLPAARVAYLIPGSDGAIQAMCQLIQNGIRIHVADEKFTINGREFDRGTLIAKVAENPADLNDRIQDAMQQHGLFDVIATDTAYVDEGAHMGGPDVKWVKPPKVLLVVHRPTNYSSGHTWHLFDQVLNYPTTRVTGRDYGSLDLDEFNTIVLPDGAYSEQSGFSKKSAEELMAWIRKGGTLITLRGATRWAADPDIGLLKNKLVKRKVPVIKQQDDAETKDNKPEKVTPDSVPGAFLRADVFQKHWVTFAFNEQLDVFYTGNTILSPTTETGGRSLVTFVDRENLLSSGFCWPTSLELVAETPFVVYRRMGRGHLIAFTDDPNYRGMYPSLQRLFINAAMFGAGH